MDSQSDIGGVSLLSLGAKAVGSAQEVVSRLEGPRAGVVVGYRFRRRGNMVG